MNTTIITADEARAVILRAIEFAGREEILGEIVQYNNTTDNDIDEAGNVWVSAPQVGHWLDDDRLIEFAKFLG